MKSAEEAIVAIDLRNDAERRRWLRRMLLRNENNAKKKGFVFTLPSDYAETLYLKQRGRCEVTGIPFHLERFADALVKHPFAPSIDRRLSTSGYTPDNVRLVCVAVNFGMGQWGQEMFLTLARHAVAREKVSTDNDVDLWQARQLERIRAAETIRSILPPEEQLAQAHHISGLRAAQTLVQKSGLEGLRERATRARQSKNKPQSDNSAQ
jgi:hypothetical protein